MEVSEGLAVFSAGLSLPLPVMLSQKTTTLDEIFYCISSACQNYSLEEAKAKIVVSKAVSCETFGYQP